MAIKFVELTGVTSSTDAEGVVTITGTREEQSFASGLFDAVLMPTKISDDENYVAASSAALASVTHGVLWFHVADFMHARNGAAPISPVTGLFAK